MKIVVHSLQPLFKPISLRFSSQLIETRQHCPPCVSADLHPGGDLRREPSVRVGVPGSAVAHLVQNESPSRPQGSC